MLWKKERKDGAEELEEFLEPVARGLELDLIELSCARHKRGIQVRAIIFRRGGVGIDDCSRFHRAITPRLELSFPSQDISIEVSSPGIDRLIRDGLEFAHYTGCPVKYYLAGGDDWRYGILERVTETFIETKGIHGMEMVEFAQIAKAKLDSKAAA